MVSATLLIRVTVTRFLPAAAALLALPVLAAARIQALPHLVWALLALQIVAIGAGFLTALVPLRRRLDRRSVHSLRWHVGSAALAVWATAALSFFVHLGDAVGFTGLIGASVSGGLVGALPLLVRGWDELRSRDANGGNRDGGRRAASSEEAPRA